MEAEPGRFVLARESTVEPLRLPVGTPRPFTTQSAAERFAKTGAVRQGKRLAAVPFQAPEGRRCTLGQAEPADKQEAVRAKNGRWEWRAQKVQCGIISGEASNHN